MQGRPPKPTNLHFLHGNPGKRARDRDDVNPDVLLPTPPDIVAANEVALAEYQRLGAELLKLRCVSEIDRGELASYCMVYARWIDAEKMVKEHGPIIRTPNGYPAHSPYLAIAQRCIDQMNKLGAGFGLNPAARSRINLDAKQGDLFGGDAAAGDPLSQFLANKPGTSA